MRIALLSSQLAPGPGATGIGTYVRLLANGLAASGHDVTVFTSSGRPPEPDRTNVSVCQVELATHPKIARGIARIAGLSNARMAVERSAALVRAFVQQHRASAFDVVEAPLFGAEGYAYRQRLGVPLVIRLQTPAILVDATNASPPARMMAYLEARALRRAARVAALSHSIAETVVNSYGCDPVLIDYAPIGMDPVTSAAPKSRADNKGVRGLFVGRLEPRKGAAATVAALRSALISCPELSIDFVGTDSPTAPGGLTHANYATSILAAECRDRVRFHNYVAAGVLARFYEKADFFIAPSTYESFGLVYLEAMRHGLPIIAVGTGGAGEVVNESCALLVQPDDAEGISNAVVRLYQDRDLRRTLSRGARARLTRDFSTEMMVETTIACYERATVAFGRRPLTPTED